MKEINHLCFAGTPEFSVPVLQGLVGHFGPEKISVITMPDKAKGRGKKIQASPVCIAAQTHNLPIFKPESKSGFTQCINEISPSLIIVVAYGMIIEKVITDNFFCINIHSSLLPKYRGASPIHSAILNNEALTGITLIKMNERMDEGDIIYQKPIKIQPNDTLGTLTTTLSLAASRACLDFLSSNHALNRIACTPQDHSKASYTQKIHSSDCEVTCFRDLNFVHQKIRAYSPNPGAFTLFKGKRIKLLASTFKNKVFELTMVQPEGKRAMAYSDYLMGGGEALY